MTYHQCVEFLYGLRLFGMKLGLENTRRLAALAGNPQERLRFIHVAGTNGKGSVAAMLESIYRSTGLKVGLFTSPHLVSFRERIQVNRSMISEADVIRHVAELTHLTGPMPRSNPHLAINDPHSLEFRPTFFECVVVMALRYFDEQCCDLVIWETGLGGRLDATNIVHPMASVITNVQADHQRWLGSDLVSIAREKAGIIKPEVPVITAVDQADALKVIQTRAAALNSQLIRVVPEPMTDSPVNRLRLPFPGQFQRLNAATAIATVRALQHMLPVDDHAVTRALENVQWPGRAQVLDLSRRRRLFLDGAHNRAAARSLRAVLEDEFPNIPLTLIVGILKDKDWETICRELAPVASHIVCVRLQSDRSADPKALAEACRRFSGAATVEVGPSVGAAIESLPSGSVAVIAGSLYLVGEALETLERCDPRRADEVGLNDWLPARPG